MHDIHLGRSNTLERATLIITVKNTEGLFQNPLPVTQPLKDASATRHQNREQINRPCDNVEHTADPVATSIIY